MMTFLKRSVLSLIAIVVVLTIVAYLLPSKVHVERAVVINATPDSVFREVNDLKRWSQWSPWHLMDPDANYNYSGPDSGVGATANWKGEKVGEGQQTIKKSEPYSAISTSLDFGAQGVASSDWTFTPEGDGTKVVWGFDTDMGMNPISRYFGLVMDRMIGADYEKGLNNLKEFCERPPQDASAPQAPSQDPANTDATSDPSSDPPQAESDSNS